MTQASLYSAAYNYSSTTKQNHGSALRGMYLRRLCTLIRCTFQDIKSTIGDEKNHL